ncbi:receptor protein kinase TMK1-like [Prosopis cineraria]|uniref:receptor protein kinase TMK1-like n=1 Tax=Prosopis cineraria TaxID=364024 RepID=UPI00240F4DDF|nr:receptor protein kinase TMK1-like [Prosopis cineraria]
MEKLHSRFGVSFVYRILLILSMVLSARPQDAAVMAILKNSIKGSSSLQWSDPDVCKWSHVQCNSAKRVAAIQIGNLNLQGSLPKELSRLTELQRFECQSNSLSGAFPSLASSLQHLYISDNGFTSMPPDFFKGMSMLEEVRIDHNPFPPWQVPDVLKDCVALQTFSAQNVSFVGEIPDIFGKDGPFPGLTKLILCFNQLEGGLPSSFSGSSIELLWVNGQKSSSKLNGTLAVFQNLTSLKQIWIHGNSFTGPIPDLSHHDELWDVSLRDNQLTGVVPSSLMTLASLQVVNLTNNYLQGPMPAFKSGVRADIEGINQFCTTKPGQPCSSLVNALLSVAEPLGYPLKFAQNWKGNDPCAGNWIGIVCTGGNITVVNFQNMGLSGTISPSLSSLTSVKKLLLANNNLTGTIPRELTSMPVLQELDVSNNHMYGKVPTFRQDVTLKTAGNPDIGKDSPSPPPGSPNPDNTEGNGKKHNSAVIIVIVVVGVVVLLGVLLWGLVWFNRKRKHSKKIQSPNAVVIHPQHSGDRNHLKISVVNAGTGANGGGTNGRITSTCNAAGGVDVVEAGGMVISIQVLREATNNFSKENILGKGGFGTVYKGELHDGTKIAVKRMESGVEGVKGLSEFKAEITVLTKVRHKHLVALMGYCLDGNERLLVYEYMPQGTLSRHLFNWRDEGLKPLEWTRRLIIALDVARGVEYLHGLAQQIFIHRDLKPSNILLGDDMRAKVSDFGLVRLAPEGKVSFETRLAGTFGYLAPEYAVTGRVTTKVDVYSFGVILMEMITGRKALDDSQTEENVHLVAWFRKMVLNKDTFRKAIDPEIEVSEETVSSINTVAELAGHCCAREPSQRPDMGHAVNVLAPLVEVWKPAETSYDDICGIDLDMDLPRALKKWQAFEGVSSIAMGMVATSSLVSSADSTQSSIPPRPFGLGASFTSSDGR